MSAASSPTSPQVRRAAELVALDGDAVHACRCRLRVTGAGRERAAEVVADVVARVWPTTPRPSVGVSAVDGEVIVELLADARIADATSLDGFARLLADALAGQPGAQPRPGAYARVARWLADLATDEDTAAERAAHDQVLAEPAPSWPLARASTGPFAPRELDARSEAAAALAAAGAALGPAAADLATTPEALACAAWAVLAARVLDRPSVVLGLFCDGRGLAELDAVFGRLALAVPLALALDPAARVADFAREVGGSLDEARDAQHSFDPSGRGLATYAPLAFAASPPLVSLERASASGSVAVRGLERRAHADRFELLLELRGDALVVHRDAARIDLAVAERVAAQLAWVIASICADSSRRLVALELVGPEELRWQAEVLGAPRAEPAPALLDRIAAAARPTAIAVVDPWVELSYAALERGAAELAAELAGAGVERVALLCSRGASFVVAMLAAMRAGATWVPLEPSHPIARLEALVDEAGVDGIIYDQRCAATGEALARPAWVLDARGRRIAGPPSTDSRGLPPSPRPEAPAYLIFTSGSTGRAKGVLVSHAALSTYADAIVELLGEDLDRPPVIAAISSLATDLPLTAVLGALATGGTAVLPGPDAAEDADELAALFAGLDARIGAPLDALKIVPSQLGGLLDALEGRSGDGASGPGLLVPRRLLILGGEAPTMALAARVRELVPGCEIVNHYGPTETTVGVSAARLDPALTDRRPPIGRPLARAQLRILDARLRPVPVGAVGELYIGGPSLALGYARRPGASADRFVPDPQAARPGARLHRSGDRARLRADGMVELLGRVDDQVKVHGVRVELAEIEAAVRGCADVAEVAVVHDAERDALVAWLVPRSGARVELDALVGALAEVLPRELIPRRCELRESLPRTASGKVDRRALVEALDGAGGQLRARFEPARDARERALAEILAAVLERDAIGRHDDFFALGGDSILGVSVVARARRAGLSIAVRDLFEHPTVAALARVAGAKQAAVTGERPAPTEPFALTPNLRWLRELGSPRPSHFNQALAIGLRPAVAPARLERALDALAEHHEVLRARVELERGQVRIDDGPVRIPVGIVDDEAALSEAIADAHASLDLAAGPMVAGLVAGAGAELILVAHHACVDAVSWRILLEDLDQALAQLDAGQAIALTPVPTTWSSWARARAERDGRDAGQGSEPGEAGETSDAPAPGTLGQARVVERALEPADGQTLARWAPVLLGVGVETVLVAAAARALAAALDRARVSVELEGHGRDDDGLDTSRTVGWLTSRRRLELDAPPDDGDGGELGLGWIRAVEQARVRGPERGAASGPALLGCNYFGALATGLRGSRFEAVAAAPGCPRDPDTPRATSFELLAAAEREGRITLRWTGPGGTSASVLDAVADEQARALAEQARALAEQLARLCGPDPDAVEDIVELGPLQVGILADCLASPGLYLAHTLLAFDGPLDVEAMRGAWSRTLARHTALRTTFAWDGLARPLQLVWRELELPFALVDARDVDAAGLDAILDRARREAAAALGDPGGDRGASPLLRVTLIRAGDSDWRLLWSRHHLIVDGWSAALVLREVLEDYAGGDPGPGSRYGDWVRGLRGRKPGASLAFWREQLAGYPGGGLLDAGARRREAHRSGTQARTSRPLPPTLDGALASLARSRGLTINATIQAAFALLLSRWSGRDDLVFGVTSSGRGLGSSAAPQATVGLLINTLPLRARIDERLSFVAWATQLQRDRVRVEDHHATPLAALQALVPRAPLFDAIVVGGNYPIDRRGAEDIAGLRLRGASLEIETSVPLTLRISPGDTLTLELLHDRARFDAAWAEARLAELERLLAALVAEPGLTLAELRARPARWAARPEPVEIEALQAPPEAPTLHAWLAAQAVRRPERPAMAAGDQCLSYGDLARRAAGVAAALAARGVNPGAVVGLAVGPRIERMILVYGVWAAGAAILPLDPGDPRSAEFVVEVGARLLVESQPGRLAGPTRGELERLDAGALLRAGGEAEPAPEPVAVPPAQPAWLVLTSGSTGRPKAVAVPHAAAVHYAAALRQRLDAAPESSWGALASFAVDLGYTAWLGALATGGCLRLFAPEAGHDPAVFAAAMAATGVDYLKIVPSHLEALLGSATGPELVPRRALILGGEAMRWSLVDRLAGQAPDCAVFNHYGPSEATIGVVAGRVETDPSARTTIHPALGRPLPGVRVAILDAHGRPVPRGSVGELCVGGPTLALGYWRRPGRSAAAFVPDPDASSPGARLYRTGDRVRVLPDGQLLFLGRLDGQLGIRGFRIEPGEIEAALVAGGGIRQVRVVARPLSAGGEPRLVAYAVAEDGAAAGLEAAPLERLRHADRLPAHMIPSALIWLERLPLSAGGKLDVRALPAPELAAAPASLAAARTAEEAALVPIWAGVLGRAVGVDDDFFAAGGDSLQAIELTSRVRKTFGISTPVQLLFEHPSPARMAAALLERPEAERVRKVARVLAKVRARAASGARDGGGG